jgi:tRNA (guanine37-N1)-methyltransferase
MIFKAIALTLFPDMFPGPLGHSIAGKALEKGLWSLQVLDLRDFATDKHRTVDDSPYGGGTGMVMKPDVLGKAIEHAKSILPDATIIYPSPRGVPMTQTLVEDCKNSDLIILCGRFEGIDQRVIDHYGMLEVSLGDFVLSGGEIAALALLDAVVRLIPGVIGNEESIAQESFGYDADFGGLLEYPHYTRPPDWNGLKVPEVLLSGDHKKIQKWRLEQAKAVTQARRPDLHKIERQLK